MKIVLPSSIAIVASLCTFPHLSVSLSSDSFLREPIKSTPCNRICRYNSNYYDGKVCIGCHRDEHDIAAWVSLSPKEKNYALMDAADRSVNGNGLDGALSAFELKRQAAQWLDVDATLNNVARHDAGSVPREVTELLRINNVFENECCDRTGDKTPTQASASPCKQVCRYSKECYDGNVCIGCYRDTYEIGNWEKMSSTEKMYALEDAADRRRNVERNSSFILSASEKNLMQQALLDSRNLIFTDVMWEEYDIRSDSRNKLQPDDEVSTFLNGDSVLLSSSIISPAECEEISAAARIIANEERSKRLSSGLSDKGLVRIPIVSAKERANKIGTPCAASLDEHTDRLLTEIFGRICKLLDKDHPSLITSLFGQDSLFELYSCGNLAYSSREPAINVYTKGGKFLPHEDGQKLTILVPLSKCEDFNGGGTAFWCPNSTSHRINPPSMVIRPVSGSVLLFVGSITHAGVVVEEGERVLFVASFSVKRG
uniref:Fe2OG dioxygenase domain-containing protein n=1 Tax=Chaetoceros debilis TaxID=122233 RepID=A0A6S8SVQ4_9STRA